MDRFLLLEYNIIVDTTSKADKKWFPNWKISDKVFTYTGTVSGKVEKLTIKKTSNHLEDLMDCLFFIDNKGRKYTVPKDWVFDLENQDIIETGRVYGLIDDEKLIQYDIETHSFVEIP